MEVLGICMSPRKGGNSEILLKEALRGSKECGAKIEFLSVRNLDIKSCNACNRCRKDGVCAIKDEMQGIYHKLMKADGLIFATPVYYWSIAGSAKVFLDRTYALRFPHLKLMNKVGGAITVASSAGNISTHSVFHDFFVSNHMITTDFVWGYAMQRETVRKHKHAMFAAYELGRLVSSMISNGFRYPDEFNLPIYALVKQKYGIHMSPYENPPDAPVPE
jgi:multimeric flavodoxin WrbA